MLGEGRHVRNCREYQWALELLTAPVLFLSPPRTLDSWPPRPIVVSCVHRATHSCCLRGGTRAAARVRVHGRAPRAAGEDGRRRYRRAVDGIRPAAAEGYVAARFARSRVAVGRDDSRAGERPAHV